jgi:hypothetical protein
MSSDPHKGMAVVYGIKNIICAIEEFINKANTRYDVCADSSIPSFIIKKGIISNFIEFKNNRNGQIRYITEVTADNLDYCKLIMEAGELRHLKGLKGVFRVNETEYHHNIILDEQNQMAIMIYSKISEIVSQYQNVFDVLWEKAIPFRDRMNQIQGIEVSSFAIRREVNYQPPAITDISDISDQKLTPPGMEYKNINKSIEKESARMLVDDQITNKQKTNPLSQSSIQIQLWSNDSKTHYAIKLSNQEEFLAATMSPTIEKYTALVEESAYIKDFQYDWDYTLMHWINNQK